MDSTNIVSLLQEARSNGMTVIFNEGKLAFRMEEGKTPLPRVVDDLKLHKQEIIRFLQSEDYENIQPAGDIELIPLSFAQERLWFIDKMQGSTNYHIPITLKLTGRLNEDELEFALRKVIHRHLPLRAIFYEEKDKVYQRFRSSDEWNLKKVDLTSEGHPLKKIIEAETSTPFDLSLDFMVRATLIQNSPDEWTLIIVIHHIAFDAWSNEIFIDEVIEHYNSRIDKRNTVNADLKINYADYSVWQRKNFTDQKVSQSLDYWKTKLNGFQNLDLPTDFVRPLIADKAGEIIYLDLDTNLSNQIRECAKKEDCTVFMVLLAAFKVLLYRYSNQPDICVGTAVAGRTMTELEPLVGLFLNTIAIRTSLHDGSDAPRTYRSLLAEVRQNTLEGYTHQHVPFEKVVESVVRRRDASRSPLIQVMFGFTYASTGSVKSIPGLRVERIASRGKSQFDLIASAQDGMDHITLFMEFANSLFKESTVRRMLTHFKNILKHVMSQPAIEIDKIAMLDKQESDEMIFQFGTNVGKSPTVNSVLDLFNEQVQKHPRKIAVKIDDQEINYGELHERSNRIANYLVKHNAIRKQLPVGICVSKSIEMIAGILGILKVGSAYLPLDPTFPQDRLEFMINDSRVEWVLCNDRNASIIGNANCRILSIGDPFSDYNHEPPHLPDVNIGSDDHAYVIYTSGTTGRPKGVALNHGGLVNHVINTAHSYSVDHSSRFLQFFNIGFDAAAEEIFTALCFGATLHIWRNPKEGPQFLIDMINREKLTHIDFSAAYLEAFTAALTPGQIKNSLVNCATGGEKIDLGFIRKNFDLLSSVTSKLCNVYGPTETTLTATIFSVLDDRNFDQRKSVPIGKPQPNRSVYILDKNNSPVPVGITGELCIGGSGVASGYLNNEALTATKFIVNKFADDRSLIYKTGDLGRWLDDGNIEYLGRVDEQVKIRGYRIELGEIENTIQVFPGVKHAAVVVKRDTGDSRLIAYIVPSQNFDLKDLEKFVKTYLPDYMVPASWVIMDELPLSANGKVDRRTLPDPPQSQPIDYQPPLTHVEKELVKIWSELFARSDDSISIDADFFELGGHSLLTVRAVVGIKQTLGLTITIYSIFDHPTIKELARYLETLSVPEENTSPVLSPVRPERIPLSFQQERLWFSDRLSGSIEYNIASCFSIEGALNVKALGNAFNQVIQRHEILRTIIKEEQGVPYQVVLDGDKPWRPEYVKVHSRQLHISDYIVKIRTTPFQLDKEPCIRVHIVEQSKEKFVLIVVTHHIISDGWSQSIMMKEVMESYRSMIGNRPLSWLPLPMQYADYAIWQRSQSNGNRMEEGLNYWSNKLKNVPSVDLPTDFRRPTRRSIEGNSFSFTINDQLKRRVDSLVNKQRSTLFMLLLSVFKVLLYKYTGQSDICVGTPSAGRIIKDTEPLIGLFINTLAIRTDLSGNPGFDELLSRVKKGVIDDQNNQDIPFERIVETVERSRDQSKTPIFQVMFALQNMPVIKDEYEINLNISDYEVQPALTSIFDLSFTVIEAGNVLHIGIEYSTLLFKESTIKRLAQHFQQLISEVVSNPSEQIDSLSIITAREERTILTAFNSPIYWNDNRTTILDRFEANAMKTPGSIAVVCDDERITYRQLNERANQLAHYLTQRGIKPGDLVGLFVVRSADMIMIMLAVMKAGAAYVPIDPDFPRNRIEFVVKNSGIVAVVISPSHTDLFALLDLTDLIDVRMDWNDLRKHSSMDITRAWDNHNAAYVLYTSGSSGKPKGVVIEHSSLMNLCVAMIEKYRLRPSDKVLQFASISFDMSIEEIFPALTCGATLVIRSSSYDFNDFLQLLNKEQVSVMTLLPHYLNGLLSGGFGIPAHIRLIALGGDKIIVEDALKIRKDRPDITLVNGYGPTECTVNTSFFIVGDNNQGPIPIGTPVSNSKLYVLDGKQQLLPIGIPGELYVGGIGVARGYLNNVELTNEKFLHHSGLGRIYRTGDLVRWNNEGNLEFLGRADSQVKIRGFRIEVEEIEATLMQNPSVKQGIVIHKASESGGALVAYVVPSSAVKEDELLSFLKERLPRYMVPSSLILLERYPVLPNGKIDKAALPVYVPDDTDRYVPPINSIEKVLVEIWSAVLSKEIRKISTTANFFEIGGHSLRAIMLTSSIRKQLNFNFPLTEIFFNPTVKEMADYISVVSLLNSKAAMAKKEIAPAKDIEETLFNIWAELLNIENKMIGTTDNFFDLGGDSLLATQLVLRISEDLGVKIPIDDLFKYTTIKLLSGRIESLQPESPSNWNDHIVPLNSAREGVPVFVLPGSLGIAQGYEFIGKAIEPFAPVYGLNMMGINEGETPFDQLSQMVEFDLQLIKSIQPEGPYRFIAHSFGAHIVHEIVKSLEISNQKVSWVVVMDVATEIESSKKTSREEMIEFLRITLSHIFDKNDADQKLLMSWKEELESILDHCDVEHMIPAVRKYLNEKLKGREFYARLINLVIANDLTNKVTGIINAPVIIAKAEDNVIVANTSGWNAVANQVTTFTLPGDHLTMIGTAGATRLVPQLKQLGLL